VNNSIIAEFDSGKFERFQERKAMTNGEFKVELEKRTVAFSVAVLQTLRKIPVGIESRNIKDQLARSATAIGANYREANRAESKSDFLHKISVVAKEASESEYWLLLLKELYPNISEISQILIEARELLCIFDKIRATMRNKDKQ
jgi:four helix bundle protein